MDDFMIISARGHPTLELLPGGIQAFSSYPVLEGRLIYQREALGKQVLNIPCWNS